MSIRCSCGEANKEGAQFCNRCGKRLDGEAVSNDCPGCGNKNPGFAEYCGVCGGSLKGNSPRQTTPTDDETTDDDKSWSKTYGIPGFYESSISEGPGGANIQTKFSALGFEEVSTYPIWMITFALWGFLALLSALGLVVISAALKADRTDLVALGLGILGGALLAGYATYRVYYQSPGN